MLTMKNKLSAWCLLLVVALTSATMQAQSNHNLETAKQLDIFNSLYRDLDLNYVDTIDAKKNIENAILFMLDQLDPYTEYFPANRNEEIKQMTTGKYAGVGAIIAPRKDLRRCIISTPYEGMPAANVGLRRGDVILSIGGVDTGELDTLAAADYSSKVSNMLRGEPGTSFDIRIRRPGISKELTFKVTRQAIVLPSITCATIISDSIGYILLSGYTENTSRDMRQAVITLKQQGARRLILDLRGNPGGLMGEAINLVNLFIPRGKEVVSTRGKVKENTQTYKTSNAPLDLNIPIAVLINYGSASSAEITSGALQDYDRAVVIGQRSYGKGLVQETRPMPFGGVLKVTTSKYYIPSGRCIQAYKFEDGAPVHLPDSLSKVFHTAAGRPVRDGGGITPDVEVKDDSLPNLLGYLSISDQLTDYCATYRNTHPQIAPADQFHLTDEEYAQFCQYLKDHHFTYDRQSLRVLSQLRKLAKREGYSVEAEKEFAALEAKLSHNEDFDFQRWKKEIKRLVEMNLVGCYYYDRGAAVYSLGDDKVVREALQVLQNDQRYRQLLKGDKE